MQRLTTIRQLLLAGVLCTFVSLCAAEPDDLLRINARIKQYPVIRAEFTQNKQIAAMKHPLVTTGHLIYSRQQGVLWQIELPYHISYILGTGKIIEISADGIRRERRLRDVPGLAQIGQIFGAIFSTNTMVLRQYFDATVQSNPERWNIELKPRQPQMMQFLTGVQLSGNDFVDSIHINEAGGDTTQINFRNTQGANTLNSTESQLFGNNPSETPENTAKP
jgi:hypothetical protein